MRKTTRVNFRAIYLRLAGFCFIAGLLVSVAIAPHVNVGKLGWFLLFSSRFSSRWRTVTTPEKLDLARAKNALTRRLLPTSVISD